VLHELVQLRVATSALVLLYEERLQVAQLVERLHVQRVVFLGRQEGGAQLAQHCSRVLERLPQVALVLRSATRDALSASAPRRDLSSGPGDKALGAARNAAEASPERASCKRRAA